MPLNSSIWIKTLRTAAVGAAMAGLTACAGQTKDPELIRGSEVQVVIVADLDNSPKPLANSYCAQFGKRPSLRDTTPAKGNFLNGWATGTKVFIFTFDCR